VCSRMQRCRAFIISFLGFFDSLTRQFSCV
jgi:hypothetical protein